MIVILIFALICALFTYVLGFLDVSCALLCVGENVTRSNLQVHRNEALYRH